jgi:hypothetical protein
LPDLRYFGRRVMALDWEGRSHQRFRKHNAHGVVWSG